MSQCQSMWKEHGECARGWDGVEKEVIIMEARCPKSPARKRLFRTVGFGCHHHHRRRHHPGDCFGPSGSTAATH